jgi:hypothetical protein
MRIRDPADAMIGHPKPGDDVETCKVPLPGMPTVGVRDLHQ